MTRGTDSATGRSRGDEHEIVLRWLDHQIVGPGGDLLGNVDDLELVPSGPRVLVTGIMVGPAALSQRLPGRLGEWTYAVWRRLHPALDPQPVVLPVEHVTSVDSAVHVDAEGARALAASFGLELWARRYVVQRIPGALSHDVEGEPPRAVSVRDDIEGRGGASAASALVAGLPAAPARAPRAHSLPLSAVIGREVRSEDGRARGRVSELRCTGHRHDERQAPLVVTRVHYTRSLTGATLGYSADRHQGPAVLRRVMRWWHRDDRLVDVARVSHLLERGVPVVVEHRSAVHPHEADRA